MADPRNGEVASFFLDTEGEVESASGNAKQFCEEYFDAHECDDGFLPQAILGYMRGALKRQKVLPSRAYKGESVVFSFLERKGVVDCLLQDMGACGHLFCLTLSR